MRQSRHGGTDPTGVSHPRRTWLTAEAIAWTIVLVAVSVTMAWPFLRNAVLLSDDAEMLFAHLGDPFRFHGWDDSFFRPLDTFSAVLVDPVTRDARVSLLLHLPPLIALAAAVRVAVRELGATTWLAAPLAMSWWLLSVGTTIALWQPDLISQTWGAAIGIWLGLVLWFGAREAATGTVRIRTVLWVTALTVAGLLTREFFLGWAAGGVGLVAACFIHERLRRRVSVVAWLRLAAPVIVIPVVFVLLRIYAGGLGNAIASSDETGGRYDVALGMNVVRNLALIAVGLTAVGPAHMVDNPSALAIVRVAPLVGSAMTVALIASPWILSRVLKVGHDRLPDLRGVALVLLVGMSGILPAIPLQHVSEYYLFGPNFATALLIGLMVPASWAVIREAAARGASSIGATPLALMLALCVLIGLLGSVSRARNIDVNWEAVRAINQEVGRLHVASGAMAGFDVRIAGSLTTGPQHGVFVDTPAHLYDFTLSEGYLNERFERPKIHFVFADPAVGGETPQFELDVEVPTRPDW